MASSSNRALRATAKAAWTVYREQQQELLRYRAAGQPQQPATMLDRLRELLDMVLDAQPEAVLDDATPYAWVDGLQFTLRRVTQASSKLQDFNLVLVTQCPACHQTLEADVGCLYELGRLLDKPPVHATPTCSNWLQQQQATEVGP